MLRKQKLKKKTYVLKSQNPQVVSKNEGASPSHSDPEGKVIFQYEETIPTWMINKLVHYNPDDKNEVGKCWDLSI